MVRRALGIILMIYGLYVYVALAAWARGEVIERINRIAE